MASGAPTIQAAGIQGGTDALMRATAEPSNAVRAAPTTGESPQAKRPSKRDTAPHAPAATQDMTTAELTHAVQGILSQQDRDGRWMEVIRDVIEDHAKFLDDERSSRKLMNTVIQETRAWLEGAFAEIAQNDATTKKTIEENDVRVKKVVEDLGVVGHVVAPRH